MLDPREGLTAEGRIHTGADHSRIPKSFAALLDAAQRLVAASAPEASLYVYGSVATGTARVPESDVDLLTIGLAADQAAEIGQTLSDDFAAICRGVEIAAAMALDFEGETDEAYGGRVFLHHYCLHLAGPNLDGATAAFRGDIRAARGFNGDIAQHAERWRHDLATIDAAELGRRVARKSLLAVAALVSVHDATWTTDRDSAAQRWQQIHPELGEQLDELVAWSSGRATSTTDRLHIQLDTTIDRIIHDFETTIGLWPT